MLIEVETLRKHTNKYLIKYIDSFRDQNSIAYLVLEYASGGNLKKYMMNRFEKNPIKEDESRKIIL